jgi:hypothetical protein
MEPIVTSPIAMVRASAIIAQDSPNDFPFEIDARTVASAVQSVNTLDDAGVFDGSDINAAIITPIAQNSIDILRIFGGARGCG